MQCKNCGSVLPVGMNTCPNCGFNMVEFNNANLPNNNGKKMKIVIIAAIIIVALSIILFLLIGKSNNGNNNKNLDNVSKDKLSTVEFGEYVISYLKDEYLLTNEDDFYLSITKFYGDKAGEGFSLKIFEGPYSEQINYLKEKEPEVYNSGYQTEYDGYPFFIYKEEEKDYTAYVDLKDGNIVYLSSYFENIENPSYDNFKAVIPILKSMKKK